MHEVAWKTFRKRFLQLRERKSEAHQFGAVEPRRKVAENRMSNLKEAFLALLEVLAVFLVLAIVCLVAMYLNGRYRLWIIRATMGSSIPGWLKSVLWGW
jgi:hypothetical protein